MGELVPFALEDFFVEYEHRSDLINLASSDSAPWTLRELQDSRREVGELVERLDFAYPDVDSLVVPRLRQFYGDPEGVSFLPTCGAAEAIFLSLQCCDLGRGRPLAVAVPIPGYGAFSGIAQLLGCRVSSYVYRRNGGWALNPEDLLHCAAASDVLIVINPHNPTGSIADGELLRETCNVLRDREGVLIVDEVFRLPSDCRTSLGFGANVVVIGSLSKVYGLPGLRFGWVAAEDGLIAKMRTLQQYLTLSLSSLAAHLGSVALDNSEQFSRQELLMINRRLLADWAGRYERAIRITEPQGGTTVILEVLTGVEEEEAFSELLGRGVLLVPGRKCFGVGDRAWFRLGYGAKTELLRDGLDRTALALAAQWT